MAVGIGQVEHAMAGEPVLAQVAGDDSRGRQSSRSASASSTMKSKERITRRRGLLRALNNRRCVPPRSSRMASPGFSTIVRSRVSVELHGASDVGDPQRHVTDRDGRTLHAITAAPTCQQTPAGSRKCTSRPQGKSSGGLIRNPGVGSVELHSRYGIPPAVQIGHHQLHHQVRSEGVVPEVLQDELGFSAPEARIAPTLPELLEPESREQTSAESRSLRRRE